MRSKLNKAFLKESCDIGRYIVFFSMKIVPMCLSDSLPGSDGTLNCRLRMWLILLESFNTFLHKRKQISFSLSLYCNSSVWCIISIISKRNMIMFWVGEEQVYVWPKTHLNLSCGKCCFLQKPIVFLNKPCKSPWVSVTTSHFFL